MADPPQLKADIASMNGVAEVTLAGDLDAATAPVLDGVVGDVIDSGVRRIRLDCGALAFMDSSGLSSLVRTVKRLGDDGELRLTNAGGHVRKVVEICGLQSLLGD